MQITARDGGVWLSDVAACVDLLPESFVLDDVYAFEFDLASLHPENFNVRPKIRQTLQRLRNAQPEI